MTNVIFALPRTEYGSYADLYSLIDLSGFDTCTIDEIQPDSSNAYIITVRNGELGDGWTGARASIYLYDLEWRRAPEAPIPGVKEVWMCDKWQAELTGSKYVPIGGHPGLRLTDTQYSPYYDVAFLGYMTYRRQVIYNELHARSVRLTKTSAWGVERDTLLNQSRSYLHVHQHDDIPAVPGLRLVVAAAYKLPFITEKCADNGVFGRIYSLDYADIAHNVRYWLYDHQPPTDRNMQNSGEALHDFLCHDLTFRASVERAL